MRRDTTPSLPAFGKRLRRQRLATGLKQDALAMALGVTQTSVSRWESGAQVPDPDMQHRALRCLAGTPGDDAALRRLVEGALQTVHLVDEASHTCLAYSAARARDWNATQRGLLGLSLWRFATDEIRRAEQELDACGWWDELTPEPRHVVTSEAIFDELRITAGGMIWERLYLADGTPVRLVTSTNRGTVGEGDRGA